jgi:hypothetical protein
MEKRSQWIGGIILILLGIVFMLRLWMPDWMEFSWPFYIIGVGLLFLLVAAISGIGPLAIPGCIILGIGSILYFQNLSQNWISWTYAWTLIPGFVGVGIFFSSLFSPGHRIDHSGWFLILISLTGFVIFGGISVFGRDVVRYWPILLILLGCILGFGALVGFRTRR